VSDSILEDWHESCNEDESDESDSSEKKKETQDFEIQIGSLIIGLTVGALIFGVCPQLLFSKQKEKSN
jgi:hypothetical protein